MLYWIDGKYLYDDVLLPSHVSVPSIMSGLTANGK